MIKKLTQSISSGASLLSTKWLLAFALPLFAFQAAQAQLNYVPIACSDPYVQAQGQAGTTLLGSGDDVIFANIALPFGFQVYSTTYTTVNIGTNGFVVLLPGTNRGLGNTTLPTATAGACLYPYWDDLDINPATTPLAGVYTRVDGTAPNRIFTIEWFNAGHFADVANQVITFQVRLFEGTTRIQYKYLDVIFGGSQAALNAGASATVGIEGPLPAPRPNTLYSFNTMSLTDGQCIEWILPQACNPIPGATVTASTAPGLCTANVVVALPTFNPAGCADGITTGLRYSLNGGAFVNVALPAASITLNNVPKGANVITWQTYLIANGATTGSATQAINVVDNEAPTLTCPSNMFVNLGPGECCKIISWPTPTATDNCPFLLGPFTLNTINTGGNTNSSGGQVFFNINNTSGQPITITAFGANITNATNINVYTKAGTHVGFETNPGAWTLSGVANANTGPFSGPFPGNGTITPAPLAVPITLGPGLWGISLHTVSASSIYTNGNGANQTYTDGNITLTAGSTTNVLWTPTVFTPRVFNGRVQYQIGGAPQVIQTAGPVSGSEFCKDQSPYNLSFQVTDAAGNTGTCSFNITVVEYANPVTTLTCNDFVYVSLDETCTTNLGADQVLEGGPYGCYDDYIVQVDKTPPYGNGPWVPAVLGPSDVGKTYAVQVIDPETGNKCWGNLKVEDKLPPTLVCPSVDVPCNADALPGDLAALTPFNVASGSFQLVDAGIATKTVSVALPAGAPVTGLTVKFTTTHTWVGDIDARLTNPSGQTIVLFDRPGVPATALGCANDGMNVTFDDGAALTAADLENTCNAAVPTIAGTFQPVNPIANLLGGNLNGTWTLTVQDYVGADIGSATFDLQFSLLTAVPFPNGLVLNQDVFPNGVASYVASAGAGTPTLENCSDVTLTYLDVEVPQDCSTGLSKKVNRKWTAKDASGNTSTCIQVINFQAPSLGDVIFPPNYDNVQEDALPCGGQYPTPDYIEGLGLQGYPYVFGSADGCTIGWTYTDVVIDVCDGTYKILRKWAIIDWCTGEDVEVNQVIKVLDEEGPSIACPANLTVSTDPFSCCAIVNLPDVIVSDNCSRINNIGGMIIGIDPSTLDTIGMFPISGNLTSFPGNNLWNPDTLAAFGNSPCLPVGTHTVVYQAEDDCGNTSTCTFRLTVRDYVPPVAACTEYTVVSIGVDDPYDCYGPAGFLDVPPALDDCEGAGVTWVKASTFDQGSYDNCNNVKFTVQRMAPYSDCINALNSVNGFLPCDDQFPDFPSEFERAVAEQDSIKFYCCEVGTTQMIILRVYQLDAFGNFAIGPDGTPIHNSCMIEVEVQDKIKPVCVSPGNVTVSCEAFDPSLWAYGKPAVYDNCCLDTAYNYQGQCGLQHLVSYTQFDTVCNKGTINRTFRVYDCHGQSSQCTQRIIVTYEQDYWIKFPNDVVVTVCDGTGNYGEPVFNHDQDCELLGVSYEDQIFTVVPDACFKIERTWTIINWCTYDPNKPCVDVPNPNPNATLNAPQNLVGPIVSPPGTQAPWNPTNVPLAPGQPSHNFAQYYTGNPDATPPIPSIANNNCFRYKQIIKIVDQQDPTVSNCPASPVEYCDYTTNDPLLWNQSYWWDGVSHDLCEGDAPLTITATDACSGANINITYLLFLDLDGDGVMETVINSNNPPAPGTVNYNNLGNPNYSGGEVRIFDGRPVLPNDIYRWANHQSVSGTSRTASVQWKTFAQLPTPANQLGTPGIAPQLPYGTHKIKWTITDGCGNETYCEYQFVVKDCKAPTVVCLNGLSVNIMPGGMITLWAVDFLQYGEDNCTPANLLVYAIRKAGQGTGFPVDALGNPITSVTFDCTELGEQPVELWAMDLAGNASFCQTFIDVQDPDGVCDPNSKIDVAGALKTEGDEGLEDANVNLQSGTISLFDMTDDQGAFEFLNSVPTGNNYTVTPTKDDNPLNGVSTYDLVLISKHILGLEPLGSPYKMIAADANKSNSITTFDIVEIRKLILGIYTELPNNTSWRFVDQDFAFPNPANPFQTQFPETKSVAAATVDQVADDFVAVKVGDVNNTAIANALLTSDDRSAGTLLFDVEDREVKAGETFTLTFKGAERVQGYQFTMNLSGVEVVSVTPGAGMTMDNFGVFADAVTTSVDGEAGEFAVTFRAVKAGRVSEMLGASSRITRAEAYSLANNRLDVAFRFNGATQVISGVGFELYQNQPNPFVNKTVIGFHLPEAAEATLTVFDESGRMLFVQKGQFAKGYNAISVDRSLLNTTGLMYYKLETATDAATKKMIQTK